MDELITLYGLLPSEWTIYAGEALLILVGVRTALRGVVAISSAFDSTDGRVDWPWHVKLASHLDTFDRVVMARLPVKVPFLLEKRAHSEPVAK